jgi:hypothetical protein
MRIASLLSIFFLFLFISLSSCALTAVGGESDREVKKKCLSYLGKKYGKEFRIVSYRRFFHGGHGRYELKIKASPLENPGIQFRVKYRYSEGKVAGDQYKKAFWDAQAAADAEKVLKRFAQVERVRADLRANNSLAFNTSELRFYSEYRELSENIRHPRLKLEVLLKNSETKRAIRGLVKLAGFFARGKFEKVECAVTFGQGEARGPRQFLKFKIKKGLRVPRGSELAEMIYTEGKDVYFKANRKLYAGAEKNEREGDTAGALLLYGKIVKRNRPYRYRAYIISESAYVAEAAFRMARIYEKRGEKVNAMRMYQFLLRKMEYTEVPLKLGRSVREARKRIITLKKGK